MAELIDYVGELIHEVGPRPAGTQQEHQAAELIAARLDEFGMQVDIEEFSCARNLGWARVLYFALGVAGTAVTIFLPNLYVLGIVLVIAGVVLMLLDYVDKNPLFKVLKNSLSQNVIARHLPPGADPQSRSRKVVILANYDSTRRMVQAAPPLVGQFVLIRRVVRIAMVVLAVLLLLDLIPFLGFMHGVLAVLVYAVGAVVLLALIAEVVNLFMPWNQGVNCNASGIGVLYGLAKSLTSGVDEATARAALRGGRRRAATDGGARSTRTPRSGRSGRGERSGHSERGERSGRGDRDERGGRTGAVVGAGARAGAGAGSGVVAPAATGTTDNRVSVRGTSRSAEQTVGSEFPISQDTRDMGVPLRAETLQGSGLPSAQGDVVHAPLDDVSVQAVGGSLAQPLTPQGEPLDAVLNVAGAQSLHGSQPPPRRRSPEQPQRSDAGAAGVTGTVGATAPAAGAGVAGAAGAGATAAGTATAQRVPAWFANAKKNAEKSAERKQQRGDMDEVEVVRSRFADVPTSGRIERTDDEHEGQPGLQPGPQSASSAQDQVNVAKAATVATVTTAASQEGSGTATQQPGTHTDQRTIVPITVNPDLSGLDRAAFKVLPGEENRDGSVIVPEAQPVAKIDAPVLVTPVAPPRTQEIPAMLAPVRQTGRDGEVPTAGNLVVPARTLSPSLDAVPAPVPAQVSDTPSDPQTKLRNRLRGLPTVSAESTGSFPAYQANLDSQPVAKEELFSSEDSKVSATGAFVPLGTTGVMKPISDELLAYHNQGEGEIYIADADDTTITEHYSQTGEYSKPELVDIPDSRVKSFFGSVGQRLSGKKRERLDDSPSSWLGVDARYDARKEGNEIGSWENFHEGDEEWNGGAYGGESHEANVGAMVNLSNELLDKEVWLVALGASESANEGLHNLFANHGSELKNALFINLLGVGMGDLVFTISEGNYRPVLTDHRMQSLIASAAENMAIPLGPTRFTAFTTDGTEALRKGSRGISIMGLGDQVPVGWRWTDDDVSRLKEDNLFDVIAVISETIKNS